MNLLRYVFSGYSLVNTLVRFHLTFPWAYSRHFNLGVLLVWVLSVLIRGRLKKLHQGWWLDWNLDYWSTTIIYSKSYCIHTNHADHFLILISFFVLNLLLWNFSGIVICISIFPPFLRDKPSWSPNLLWLNYEYLCYYSGYHQQACRKIFLQLEKVCRVQFKVKWQKRLQSNQTDCQLSRWAFFWSLLETFENLRHPHTAIEN